MPFDRSVRGESRENPVVISLKVGARSAPAQPLLPPARTHLHSTDTEHWMTTITTTAPRRDPLARDPFVSGTPSGPPAVSWAAIFAGAAAAAALSLILM